MQQETERKDDHTPVHSKRRENPQASPLPENLPSTRHHERKNNHAFRRLKKQENQQASPHAEDHDTQASSQTERKGDHASGQAHHGSHKPGRKRKNRRASHHPERKASDDVPISHQRKVNIGASVCSETRVDNHKYGNLEGQGNGTSGQFKGQGNNNVSCQPKEQVNYVASRKSKGQGRHSAPGHPGRKENHGALGRPEEENHGAIARPVRKKHDAPDCLEGGETFATSGYSVTEESRKTSGHHEKEENHDPSGDTERTGHHEASGHAVGEETHGTPDQPEGEATRDAGHPEEETFDAPGHLGREEKAHAKGHAAHQDKRQVNHHASGHHRKHDRHRAFHQSERSGSGHARGHPTRQGHHHATYRPERQSNNHASGHPVALGHGHRATQRPEGQSNDQASGHRMRQGQHRATERSESQPSDHTSGHPVRRGHRASHRVKRSESRSNDQASGHHVRQGQHRATERSESQPSDHTSGHPVRRGHRASHRVQRQTNYHASGFSERKEKHDAPVRPDKDENHDTPVRPDKEENHGASARPDKENHNAPVRPDEEENHDAHVRPDKEENHGAPVRPYKEENHDASVRPHKEENHDAPVRPGEEENHDAHVRPDKEENHGAPVRPYKEENHDASVRPHKEENHDAPVRPHKEENRGAPVRPDKEENHEAPVNPDKEEDHDAPIRPDKEENHGAPVHPDTEENHGAPVRPGKEENHDAPVPPDKEENHDAPVRPDKENHGTPVHPDKEENHDTPVHPDKEENHSAPVCRDKEENHGAPVHPGKEENHDAPVRTDKEENRGAPVRPDKEENHDAPVNPDKEENHDAPIHPDTEENHGASVHPDTEENHGAPVHPDKEENHDTPVHPDKEENHIAPVCRDKEENHGAPVHPGKEENHDTPVRPDKEENHGAPVHPDKEENHDAPVHPDKKENHGAPVCPDKEENHDEPDHPNREENQGPGRDGHPEERDEQPPGPFGEEYDHITICCLQSTLLCEIFKHVHVKDLMSLKQVCKYFLEVVQSNTCLWSQISFCGAWPSVGNHYLFERAAEANNFEASVKLAISKLFCACTLDERNDVPIVLDGVQLFFEAEGRRSADAFTWVFVGLPSRLNRSTNMSQNRYNKGIAGMRVSIGNAAEQHDNLDEARKHYVSATEHGSGESPYLLWILDFGYLAPKQFLVSRNISKSEVLKAVRALRSLLTHPTCYPEVKITLAEYYAIGEFGGILDNMAYDFTRRLFQRSTPVKKYISNHGVEFYLRYAAVEWMLQVAFSKKYPQKALHSAISILDRSLSVRDLRQFPYLLIGGAALIICAGKRKPRLLVVSQVAKLAGNTFTPEDVIKMVGEVLSVLGGVVRFLTVSDFISILLYTSSFDDDGTKLVKYLGDTCLLYEDFLKYSPARIAASCVALACFLQRSVVLWTDRQMEFTGFRVEDISEGCLKIHELCLLRAYRIESDEVNPKLVEVQEGIFVHFGISDFGDMTHMNLKKRLGMEGTVSEDGLPIGLTPEKYIFLYEVRVIPSYYTVPSVLNLLRSHFDDRRPNFAQPSTRRNENLKYIPSSCLVHHEYRKANGCISGVYSNTPTSISSIVNSGTELVISNEYFDPVNHTYYAKTTRDTQFEDRAVGTSDDVVQCFGSSVRTLGQDILQGCILHYAYKSSSGLMVNVNIPVSFPNEMVEGCEYVCAPVGRSAASFLLRRDDCTLRPLSMAQHIDSCVGTSEDGEEACWFHACSVETNLPTAKDLVQSSKLKVPNMTEEEEKALETVCHFFYDMGLCYCAGMIHIHPPSCCTFSPLFRPRDM